MSAPATNAAQLVQIAGQLAACRSPRCAIPGYIADNQGASCVLPGMSGVVYNARVGDPAFGWAGDHVERGVSIDNPDGPADFALHYLTCVGNRARVTSGLASGARAS